MASAILEGLSSWMGGRGSATAGVFKFDNLDRRVQQHLTRVYFTLACATGCVALGCALQLAGYLGGPMMQVVALVSLLALAFTAPEPRNLKLRYGLLAGFSISQGASLGPLVGMALAIHPPALLTACLCTFAVFFSFSISALTTQRRAYMYLGGYIAAASLALVMMRLSSWVFGPTAGMYNLELYGGLLLFSAYILYDTQLIVERASGGDMDHVRHALDLMVDLIAVFVRVLIILIRRADDKKRDEERKKRRA